MIAQIISYKIEPGDPAPEICRQRLKLEYFKIFGHANFRVDYVPAHWYPDLFVKSLTLIGLR
jgi:hypothetical protein